MVNRTNDKRYQVIVDTNIIVSALLFHGLPENILEMVYSQDIISITSKEILQEYKRILTQKFTKEEIEIQNAVTLFRSYSEIVELDGKTYKIQDKQDQMIIETAEKGNANYIITGDRYLLSLQKYENISIVSARTFIEVIGFSV